MCFYTLLALTFQCFIFLHFLRCCVSVLHFYTSYVLFLFFMFVISTVFSLTHPLVLCNTFEYNFYSIFYNILLFQSVILVNYICCKIYNICVVFAVYFSLYDPLPHFFTHQSLRCQTMPHERPYYATMSQKSPTTQNIVKKNLTAQKQCRTKNLTTQNHAA